MKIETGLIYVWKSLAPFIKLPSPEKEQAGHLTAPGAHIANSSRESSGPVRTLISKVSANSLSSGSLECKLPQ